MPLAILWTPDRDAALLQLRADGVSWDTVGRILGVSRNTALERGRARGAAPARLRVRLTLDAALPCAPRIDVSDGRLPMPPGDPVSWGAITEGTVLAGCAYRPGRPDHGVGAQ